MRGEGKEKGASFQTTVCREIMSPLASHNTSWNPLVFKVWNTYFLYVCYRGLKLDPLLEILEAFLKHRSLDYPLTAVYNSMHVFVVLLQCPESLFLTYHPLKHEQGEAMPRGQVHSNFQ